MVNKKARHTSHRSARVGVVSALTASLLGASLVLPASSVTFAASSDSDPTATCAAGNPLSAYQPKEITPTTTVRFETTATNTPPTVNRPKTASMEMVFTGEGANAIHPGDWLYVYSQNLPIEFARVVTVDVNGEQIPIATVEREEYVSDYYRAMDSDDPTRFNISADNNPVIKGFKYKITFNQNVEGLKDIHITTTLANAQQSIAYTKNTTIKFLVQVNGVTQAEQNIDVPAWNSGVGASRSYARTDRNNGSGSYARMNVFSYDARTLSTDINDRKFMKDFNSDGVLVFNGEVGGLPKGFVATISPKTTNPNQWTWADSNIVGSKLPVYYMPYDLNNAAQTGNSTDHTAFVTPDNMYAIIERISADKRTATVRFVGDYSQPGFIVMGTLNPSKVPEGKMGTFGINFDRGVTEWSRTNVGAQGYNEAIIVDANENSTATISDTGYKLNMPNPTNSGNAQYGANNLYKASPANAGNPEVLKQGEIVVHYVDTDGNIIKDEVVSTPAAAGNVCSPYDTIAQHRPARIDGTNGSKDGKTYTRVAEGEYNLGTVLAQSNLLSVKESNANAATLKPANAVDGTTPTGQVLQGTYHVTYVYERAEGSVTINYVDINGNKIKEPVKDTVNAAIDTAYDTTADADNKRPATITAGGKVYKLVEKGTQPVGEVGEKHNLTISRIKEIIAQNDPTGAAPDGAIVTGDRVVTYVYTEVTGDVIVHYVDTEGNKINEDFTATTGASYTTPYNTAEAKSDKITKEKKVYRPAPADTYTVGTVGADNNLTTSLKDGVIGADAATGGAPSGTVGKPLTEVTYVYKEVKGDVVVRYMDNNGNPLSGGVGKFDGSNRTLTIGTVSADNTLSTTDKDSDYPAAVKNTETSSVGTAYDTADNWPTTIEKDGKVYERVEALTAGMPNGEVAEGTTVVTYYYKVKETPAKTGNVVVHYVDTAGNVIAKEVPAITGAALDSDYDTTEYKQPTITDLKTGKVYKRVAQAGNLPGVGTVDATGRLTTADPANTTGFLSKPANETGTVAEGTLDVTYVYEEVKGDVIVRYTDTEGNPLPGTGTFDGSERTLTIGELSADKTADPADQNYPAAVMNTPLSSVGAAYNTTDNKPNKITTAEGKVYELVSARTDGPEDGKVKEGTTVITYVYKEVKGKVEVTYVSTEGTPIKPKQDVVADASIGSEYNSTSDTLKPEKITGDDGRVYKIVTEASNFPAVGDVEENGHKKESAAVTGKVTEKDQTVTYVYKEIKGNVKVTYVDTEGVEIHAPQNAATDASIGSDYNATGDTLKPATLEKEGNTYDLVAAGNYTVGLVDKDGHQVDSAGITGKVTENEQTVTYVYKLRKPVIKGTVKVTYKDIDGNEIADPKFAAQEQPVGNSYNATTEELKPATLEKGGKKYELVPAGTYKVGGVDSNNHLKESDPIVGEVKETEQTVTYIYREVKPQGDVIINYVEQGTGKVISAKVIDTPQSDVGTGYDTKDHKPEVIVYTDPVSGEKSLYELVGLKADSKPEEGTVTEGTTEVTYEYKLAPQPADPVGFVTVQYKDTEGNEISREVVDEKNAPIGKQYDTLTDNRLEKITTPEGKTYKIVPAGSDYTVGPVDKNGRLESSDPATGMVKEGFQTVVYIYQEVKGNVIVHYKDTDGKTIAEDEEDMPLVSTGTTYNTDDHKPGTIRSEGKLYRLIPERTVGKENGTVVEGTTEVTYIYELVPTGNVIVHYVDENGNPIAEDVTDEMDKPVGESYDTNDRRRKIIEKNGKKYELVRLKEGDKETGTIVEGDTNVTYIYKLVEESQVPTPPVPEPPAPSTHGKGGKSLARTGVSPASTLLSLSLALLGMACVSIVRRRRIDS
ncbi:MucBP domain-containing protein [Schaalia sp. lx-260]|uniref:MucBP domain-containing protein n=1 Tax=Schaalia sp. lx-260 TaxID=2899082 RepID=UPI001E31B244|nr:MucBP domain-containing protein [Schaalia sp. lx-260]MCD4549934.1 MucBP domain-containing protein [Schaalia sp. lx-260]